jgi:hypothetical protein
MMRPRPNTCQARECQLNLAERCECGFVLGSRVLIQFRFVVLSRLLMGGSRWPIFVESL